MDDDNVKKSAQPEPVSPDWIHEQNISDMDADTSFQPVPLGDEPPSRDDNKTLADNSADTDRVVLREPLPDSDQETETVEAQAKDFAELEQDEQVDTQAEMVPVSGDNSEIDSETPDNNAVLPHSEPESPVALEDGLPVTDEITDEVRIFGKLPDPQPAEKEKAEPLTIISPKQDMAAVVDPIDWDAERRANKNKKRFLGMSPLQRFIFFLFLLIVLVVLGILFLALLGKISLQFLLQLVT